MPSNLIVTLLSLAALTATSVAQATNVSLNQSPAGWLLNEYIPNAVDIWYTSALAPCTQGHLTLPANASADDMNRFWSMVLTAKAAGKNMTIWYDSVACTITSFNLI